MSLNRIITIVFYVVVLIISVVGFAKIFGSESLGLDSATMVADEKIQSGTGWLIGLSMFLIAVVTLVTFVLGPVLNIMQNPKGILRSLMGVGVVLVVFVIGYSVAGDSVTDVYKSMGIDTPGKSKMIGGVLNTTYVLLIFGVLSYVYSSINSLLKQL